jgi:hypothetical protein
MMYNGFLLLVIEDKNGKHKFEGPQEIKEVLYEIVSPS